MADLRPGADDAELLEASARGDREAFGVFYGRHLYSLGYYLAGAHGGPGPAPGYSASVIRQIRGPWWSQQDGHDATFTAIVPDGVARVRWVFAGHGHPLLNVSIDVKGNIVSASVARALNDFPTQTTWYAPDGRPIQTTRGASAP